MTRWLLRALVFGCFFVYPSVLDIGNTGAVTIPEIVGVLVLIPFGHRLLRDGLLAPLYLWLACELIATFANLDGGDNPVTAAAKWLAVLGIALAPALAVVALQREIAAHGGARVSLVPPIALAVFIHASAGAIEYFSFQRDEFPFLGLLHSPAFANLASVSSDYAQYVKRPFGLFPEPSSMAACLGPFLLVLLIRAADGGRHRRLASIAFVAGAALMVISASVYNVVFWPLAVVILLPRLARRPGAIVLTVVAAALLVVVASRTNRDLVGIGANASFQDRYNSIRDGLSAFTNDWVSVAFGHGPGSTVAALRQSELQSTAVQSFAVSQLVEIGALALIVWTSVGARVRGRIGGAWPAWVGWLVAVFFVTGYIGLVPVWLFLLLALDGWLVEGDDPSGAGHVPE